MAPPGANAGQPGPLTPRVSAGVNLKLINLDLYGHPGKTVRLLSDTTITQMILESTSAPKAPDFYFHTKVALRADIRRR